MEVEWKWLRFEWQARGSIHAHGCANYPIRQAFATL